MSSQIRAPVRNTWKLPAVSSSSLVTLAESHLTSPPWENHSLRFCGFVRKQVTPELELSFIMFIHFPPHENGSFHSHGGTPKSSISIKLYTRKTIYFGVPHGSPMTMEIPKCIKISSWNISRDPTWAAPWALDQLWPMIYAEMETTYGGFHKCGYPNPFLYLIFPDKPSSYWGAPHDYGTPHMSSLHVY